MIYVLAPFHFLPVLIMLARRKLDPGLLLPYCFVTSISLVFLLVGSCWYLEDFEMEAAMMAMMVAPIWTCVLSLVCCITFGVLWLILPWFRFEYHPPEVGESSEFLNKS